MMMGANEDATDDGTPAEVKTPTTDVLSSSAPGKVVSEKAGVKWCVVDGDVVVMVVASEDTEFGRLETSVVVNATTDLREFGNVEVVDDCAGLERNRPVEVPVGVVRLLEPVCVREVMAEIEDEGSLAALEGVVVWTELVSVVDATADDICEKLGCELTMLTSTELCRIVAGEEVDRSEGRTIADDSTDCNVEDAEALAESKVVDVTTEKTAEVSREVTDVSMIEVSIERIVDVAGEVIRESGVEVVTGCSCEVMDVVTGTEEVAKTVGPAIFDEVIVFEGDVGPALDEATTPEEDTRTVGRVTLVEDDVEAALVATTTPKDVAWTVDKAVDGEDGVGTALEERLSALIMSAAFARVLDYAN